MSFRDPFFHRPSKRGKPDLKKGYTKFVKWNRQKIAIFIIGIGTPYIAVIYLIAKIVGLFATIPFFVLLAFISSAIGFIYWLK